MKTIVAFVVVLVVAGCHGFAKPVSICETCGPSMICQIAERYNTTPEQIGATIVMVNYTMIRSGAYDKQIAIDVLAQMSTLLERPISYNYFKSWVVGTVANVPELVELSEIFPNSPLIMYNADRKMIKGWVDRHRANVERMP